MKTGSRPQYYRIRRMVQMVVRIELTVNGLIQNVATNLSVTAGGIGFQAEGSKIQFRNLWIEPLH